MLVDMLYLCQSTFEKYQSYFFCQKSGKLGETRIFLTNQEMSFLKVFHFELNFLGYAGICGMPNGE